MVECHILKQSQISFSRYSWNVKLSDSHEELPSYADALTAARCHVTILSLFIPFGVTVEKPKTMPKAMSKKPKKIQVRRQIPVSLSSTRHSCL